MGFRVIPALASFDCHTGDLRRYERDGAGGKRVTHVAGLEPARVCVAPRVIEEFRAHPPHKFSTQAAYERDCATIGDFSPCA